MLIQTTKIRLLRISLGIPALPEDRSQINVHRMLKPFQVSLFLLVLIYTCIIAINCIIDIKCVMCIISDPKSPGHTWADQLGSIWGPSEAVLIPSNRAQTISRGTARAMLADRVQKTEKDQSPGLDFYTTSWNTFGHLSAENGHSVVLQSPVALFMCLQGRQWQQTAWMCIRLRVGGI